MTTLEHQEYRHQFLSADSQLTMHLTPPRLLGLREAKQDQQSFVDMRLESRQGSPLAQLLFKNVSSEDCESFEANEVQRQYRAWEKVELENPDGSRNNVKWFDVVVRDKDLPISPWRGPPWNDDQGDEEIQSTGSANTEERGRVVGRAKWEWRPASWAKGSETETKLDQRKQPEDEKQQLPEKLNKDLMHEFETKIEEQIRRHFDGKGHYCRFLFDHRLFIAVESHAL